MANLVEQFFDLMDPTCDGCCYYGRRPGLRTCMVLDMRLDLFRCPAYETLKAAEAESLADEKKDPVEEKAEPSHGNGSAGQGRMVDAGDEPADDRDDEKN